MPGIFGGSSQSPGRLASLTSQFKEIWPDATVHSGDGWVLGGHGFRGSSLLTATECSIVAVDGDASVASTPRVAAESHLPGASLPQVNRQPDRCNVAALNTDSGTWTLSVDWSGAFPLYLACVDGDVLFSSHLRPLARCIHAEPDPVGCLWFLREGAISGRRTFFQGIQRLDGGDVVTWGGTDGAVRVANDSPLWAVDGPGTSPNPDIVAFLTERLAVAVNRTYEASAQPALMMSGGWDSRTLAAFAAARSAGPSVLAYTHGDPGSREIRIAGEVAARCGLPFLVGAVDPSMFDLDLLGVGFARTENVVFPHWHAAGRRLNLQGADVVAAGVFGEVLGGHYGSAMVLPGLKKVGAVLGAVLGWGLPDGGGATGALEQLTRLFAPATLKRPWYAAEAWWPDGASSAATLREDVRGDLAALIRRGVVKTDQLVEAYITQRRAAHYIAAQLLSCRAVMDVGIPFIDRELLARASSVPMHRKIHNRLNREILASTRRSLLRVPLAATLVNAGSPILLREASRWVRRVAEDRSWRRHFASGGRTAPPRFSWANFEFVKESRCLLPIADDLRSPMWDRAGIARQLQALSGGGWDRPAHPIVDMIMKIYSVDHMLR